MILDIYESAGSIQSAEGWKRKIIIYKQRLTNLFSVSSSILTWNFFSYITFIKYCLMYLISRLSLLGECLAIFLIELDNGFSKPIIELLRCVKTSGFIDKGILIVAGFQLFVFFPCFLMRYRPFFSPEKVIELWFHQTNEYYLRWFYEKYKLLWTIFRLTASFLSS